MCGRRPRSQLCLIVVAWHKVISCRYPNRNLDSLSPARLLRGLRVVGRGIPRPDCEVFAGDQRVGMASVGQPVTLGNQGMDLLTVSNLVLAVLLYASEWDDADTAKEAFRLYKQVLKGKWKNMTVDTDSAAEMSGKGDDGPFRVKLEGTRVWSLEGKS